MWHGRHYIAVSQSNRKSLLKKESALAQDVKWRPSGAFMSRRILSSSAEEHRRAIIGTIHLLHGTLIPSSFTRAWKALDGHRAAGEVPEQTCTTSGGFLHRACQVQAVDNISAGTYVGADTFSVGVSNRLIVTFVNQKQPEVDWKSDHPGVKEIPK